MAGAAPPRRREERMEEERPSRRRFEEDDDDRYRRRGPRREAHETEPSTGLQIGLGAGSLVLGVIALLFGFIPCCGIWFAVAFGAIGIIVGGVGLVVALANQRAGFILPAIGLAINLVAILVAVLLYVLAVSWLYGTADRMQKQTQEALDRMQKQEEERQRQLKQKKEDDYKNTVNDPSFIRAKTTSQENLKKIAKALLDYEKKYGHLPYPRSGADGKEGQWPNGLSWRVAILPFLGRQDLYDRFKFNEASNSAANMKAAEEMPEVFLSPRHPGEKKRTYYQVFTGAGLFGTQNSPPKTTKLARDANAVFMVVEAANPVNWQAPDDIDFNTAFTPDLGGVLPGRHFNVALANGEVVFVSRHYYTDDQIRDLIPFNGGKAPPVWPPQQK
jgi:type II secretory pathway pseudopilin PulG